MRKIAMLAALALTVGAGLAQAQGGGPGRGPGGRGGGPGGPGGIGMLLRGITLTDAQKAKVEALRPDSATMEQQREQTRALFEQIRAAHESGDTVTAARLMKEQRAKMDAERDARAAALRPILTAEQQVQFDKNLAEMKEREAQFPGPRGRGLRPPGPPPAA
jgi:Spy/CpxP family protein refolding chaperone